MATIGIGKLADESGVPIDTIRHHERIGLLRPATRLASGYRRYGEVERKRLRFILRQLIAACPGHGRAEECPILNALSQDADP